MQDYILHVIFSFFEKNGYRHAQTINNFSIWKKNHTNFLWYPNMPYSLYNETTREKIDFFTSITKTLQFKHAWKRKCDEDLQKLLYGNDFNSNFNNVFDDDTTDTTFTPVTHGKNAIYCKDVHTQNLESFHNEVKLFLNSSLNEIKMFKLKSPMATRKSRVIEELLNQSERLKQSCIFVTNRISLANEISDKYDIQHYKNGNTGNNGRNKHLVTTFDSLYHFDITKFDIVILDEFQSLMMYITDYYESKFENYYENLKLLTQLIFLKKLFISDAFLINMPFLENFKHISIYNHFRESLDVTEYLIRERFITKILNSVKNHRKISISGNEKRFLHKINNFLIKKTSVSSVSSVSSISSNNTHNHCKTILLTADNRKSRDSSNQNQSNKINDILSNNLKFDVILYSPVITTGISFLNDIDEHFHFDFGKTTDAISSVQMIRRTRNAKKIHYYLRSNSSYLETDINNIMRSKKLAPFHFHDEYGNSNGLTKTGILLSYAIQIKNILRNGSAYSFRELLKLQFDNVKIDTPETLFGTEKFTL